MRVTVFSWLAVIISIFAYAPYIRDILNSKSRPTVSTWLSWFIMDTAILVGMLGKGQVAYQMIAYVIGSLAVVATCFYKKASLGWQRIDTICMSIVLLAVYVWSETKSDELLISISVFAVLAGSVPMLVKLWRDSSNESLVPWLAAFAGGICGVIAIKEMTISYALTPIAFAIFQVLTLAFILRPKHA